MNGGEGPVPLQQRGLGAVEVRFVGPLLGHPNLGGFTAAKRIQGIPHCLHGPNNTCKRTPPGLSHSPSIIIPSFIYTHTEGCMHGAVGDCWRMVLPEKLVA